MTNEELEADLKRRALEILPHFEGVEFPTCMAVVGIVISSLLRTQKPLGTLWLDKVSYGFQQMLQMDLEKIKDEING